MYTRRTKSEMNPSKTIIQDHQRDHGRGTALDLFLMRLRFGLHFIPWSKSCYVIRLHALVT